MKLFLSREFLAIGVRHAGSGGLLPFSFVIALKSAHGLDPQVFRHVGGFDRDGSQLPMKCKTLCLFRRPNGSRRFTVQITPGGDPQNNFARWA